MQIVPSFLIFNTLMSIKIRTFANNFAKILSLAWKNIEVNFIFLARLFVPLHRLCLNE